MALISSLWFPFKLAARKNFPLGISKSRHVQLTWNFGSFGRFVSIFWESHHVLRVFLWVKWHPARVILIDMNKWTSLVHKKNKSKINLHVGFRENKSPVVCKSAGVHAHQRFVRMCPSPPQPRRKSSTLCHPFSHTYLLCRQLRSQRRRGRFGFAPSVPKHMWKQASIKMVSSWRLSSYTTP